VPVLFGISVLVFVIVRILPGDPATMAAGGAMGATPEAIEAARERYGLDRPIHVQYAIYVRDLVQGDFGVSFMSKRPVTEELRQYLPATLELVVAGLALAIVIGVPLGALLAIKRGTLVDRIGGLIVAVLVGMPGFWLAIVLLVLFYAEFKISPGGGQLDADVALPRSLTGMHVVDSLVTGNWATFGNSLNHLILPAVALAVTPAAAIARMVRGSMLDALGADYVRTARAKGMRERIVVFRHGLRNALIPAVTQIGLIAGSLLNGAVFVEAVFSWDGIGRYAVTSMANLDYNPVMAVTLIAAIGYMLINLAVDLTYAFIDPRIRYE
jgi:peptide/nickel transport system permease protein